MICKRADAAERSSHQRVARAVVIQLDQDTHGSLRIGTQWRRVGESKHARRRDLARAFVLMRGVRVTMHGVALKLDCGTQRRRGGFTSLTVG